jgi:dipeptidyl aminopeptidase/acylaminoacyl peptidase
MIVERTHYYAKPGAADAVLATRRAACAVRRKLGLPVGAVSVKSGGDGPDVSWECAFATEAAHAADFAAREASSEFAAVRERMRGLISRFQRLVERGENALEGHWSGDRALEDQAIVPQEIAFRAGGHQLKGYLYLPPGPGPFPCMVTNHGSGIAKGTSDVCRPGCGALLMSWGIASFLPHRHGYGNSEGPAWRDEVTGVPGSEEYDRQLLARLERESEDVLAALGVLLKRPEIDPAHIGVMGSSFGGVMTLLAAAKSDRFRCAVEFAGAAMNWEIAPRLRAHLLDAVRRLSHPVFFIQAANDYSIGPTIDLTEAATAAGKTVVSHVYPQWGLTAEEGHLFESRGAQIWGPDVRRFLERWL